MAKKMSYFTRMVKTDSLHSHTTTKHVELTFDHGFVIIKQNNKFVSKFDLSLMFDFISTALLQSESSDLGIRRREKQVRDGLLGLVARLNEAEDR